MDCCRERHRLKDRPAACPRDPREPGSRDRARPWPVCVPVRPKRLARCVRSSSASLCRGRIGRLLRRPDARPPPREDEGITARGYSVAVGLELPHLALGKRLSATGSATRSSSLDAPRSGAPSRLPASRSPSLALAARTPSPALVAVSARSTRRRRESLAGSIPPPHEMAISGAFPGTGRF